MRSPDHLLALVEPLDDGDTTVELTRSHLERGGTARIVLVVDRRLEREIGAFAKAANLSLGDAEEIALGRLAYDIERRVGQGAKMSIAHDRRSGIELKRFVTPETTAIAVPRRLSDRRSVRRSAERTGLPMVVAPKRAA